MQFNPLPSTSTRTQTRPFVGYEALGRLVAEAAAARKGPVRIAVDGMWGVGWAPVTAAVTDALTGSGMNGEVIHTEAYLRRPEELRTLLQPWLTDNPVFGRVCDLPLSAYFDQERLSEALAAAHRRAGVRDTVLLVVGPFALGAITPDIGIYCDVHREELIRRQMNEGLRNLGDDRDLSPGARYKIAYYTEWPVQEAYKRAVLKGAAPPSHYVDCSDDHRPVAVSVAALREIAIDVVSRPFRCKPFFMPGVWGGQRLKEVAGLPNEWPNCAWDFEIVAPENAVTVHLGGARLNIPFHLLTWLEPVALMGEMVHRQFGEYFPVRINFLDTMGGTNLSLQVHPHHTYMREQFGEPIGQDESYYIVERGPGATVYLGLKESASRESLREAVHRAETEQVGFDIDDYVNNWDAQVGDLFLIPAGTVHCSGMNNLVLEISSTPYWYTFKIYDYLRPDLDGKPRPINSQHAFEVIDFTRKTEWVRENLIQAPTLLRSEPGGEEYHIGSLGMTFYSINRLHITAEMSEQTAGRFLLLSSVAGEGIQVLDDDSGEVVAEIPYLETWVVPASFGQFRLRAVGGTPCKVVKTYVK